MLSNQESSSLDATSPWDRQPRTYIHITVSIPHRFHKSLNTFLIGFCKFWNTRNAARTLRDEKNETVSLVRVSKAWVRDFLVSNR